MWTRRILVVASVLVFLFAVVPAARQVDETGITGSVTGLGGSDAIPDVEVTAFGPMEGQAKAAIASFPLMAAEISETLSIPHATAITGSDGRFRFQNLSPGLYSILAKRKGYIGPATPGAPPTSPLVSATVTVGGKEPAEVLLHMVVGEYKPQLPGAPRSQ